MKFFDLDGPVYKIGSELADIIIITFYWVLGCLPIFTIGASTASAYYVYGKKMRDENTYITKDFFKSFKQNFKQSFAVTFILAILWASATLYFMMLFAYQGSAPVYLVALAIFLCLEAMSITVYSLAVMSRFYMKVPGIFITSFILLHKHLLSTATMLIINVALVIASLSVPILLLFVPVANIAINSFFLQKLFQKHIERDRVDEVNKQELEENMDLEDDFLENDIEEEHLEQDNKQKHNKDKDNDKDFLKYI